MHSVHYRDGQEDEVMRQRCAILGAVKTINSVIFSLFLTRNFCSAGDKVQNLKRRIQR